MVEVDAPPPSLNGQPPSDQHLREVLESLPVAFMRIDAGGTLLAVNHAGLTLLGATSLEEVLGTSIVRFLPESAHQDCARLLTAAADGRGGSLTTDLTSLKGTPHALELHAVCYPSAPDGQSSASVTLRDVSATRQLAQSLVESTTRQAELRTERDEHEHARAAAAADLVRQSAQLEELTAVLAAALEHGRKAETRHVAATGTLQAALDAATVERADAIEALTAAREQIVVLTEQAREFERVATERATLEAETRDLRTALTNLEYAQVARVRELEAAHSARLAELESTHTARLSQIETEIAARVQQAESDATARIQRAEDEAAARVHCTDLEAKAQIAALENRVAAVESESTTRLAGAEAGEAHALARAASAETALQQAEARFAEERQTLADAVATAESVTRTALEGAETERRDRLAAETHRQQLIDAIGRLAGAAGIAIHAENPDRGSTSAW